MKYHLKLLPEMQDLIGKGGEPPIKNWISLLDA